MRRASGNQAEIAGTKRVRLLPNLNGNTAFENIEALFERMQVRRDGSARIEKTDAGAHMYRSHGPIHIGGTAESGAVRLVELRSLRGGWVDLGDSMHGESIYYG